VGVRCSSPADRGLTPRKLPLKDADSGSAGLYDGAEPKEFSGKRCFIVGGGDSPLIGP